jgi:acyl-CoA synthetase (AMP-forming)/AMP-acid ligase II
MLSHANVAAAAAAIIEYLGNTVDDVVLDFLPLSFDYGLYNVLMPIRFGGTVVLERGFIAPHQIVGVLRRERVTGLPLVPTIAAGFAQLRSLGGLALPDLRYITSTGQALAPAHIERLLEIFPGVRLFSMYGLTECKRATYLAPEELPRRPSSVGKAIPGTAVWIVDADGRRIEGAGVVGELVVHGPHVMQGYWNRPSETAKALRPDPLTGERGLHTGDLFRMDDEGFLYFVARTDDMVKTCGQLVSPKEIENTVLALEGVEEAVACGLPDAVLGQSIHVVVRGARGASLTAADVIAFCAARLEKWMVPRSVDIRSELPRTATGKTARREITAALIGGG